MEVGFSLKKRINQAVLVLGLIILLQTSIPLRIEIGLIRTYRTVGSPVMGYMVRCRFHPTCSEFALLSLEQEGFWVGNWQIVKRLVHCSPLGAAFDYFVRDA